MPTIQLDQIQSVINARLDALDRFAAAVAHDLGNIILPDTELKAADPSPELRKCHSKLHDLADHIITTRRALDIWRDHRRFRDEPQTVADWWFALGRLLGSVFDGDVQVRLDESGDAELVIDGGQVTRLLAQVFVALDVQFDSIQLIELSVARGDNGGCRIALRIEHDCAVDDVALGPALGRDLLGAGGCVDQFTASSVVLIAGPRR